MQEDDLIEGQPIANGYGLVNQTDLDNNESNPSYCVNVTPQDLYTQKHLQSQKGKQNIIINLCVFGSITLLFTIIFVFTLSKKEQSQKKQEQKPFASIEEGANISNEIALVHSLEEGIHCPDFYSFSPVQLKCLKCQAQCVKCYPGIGGVIPCYKCAKSFHLMGDQCLKNCPHGYVGFEGLCLPEQEHLFSKGLIQMNDTVQAELPYLLYQPKGFATKVIFLLPPVGNNHLFFSVLTDLSRFAQDSAAVILTVSTPVEQVAKFKEKKDDNKASFEEFPFIQLIGNNLIQNVDLDNVENFYYVGIGDSLFVAHELSHFIIKSQTCTKCTHQLVLMQTQNTRLASTLRLDQLELGIVLGYLDNQFELKHKDDSTVSHNSREVQKTDEQVVVETIQAAQDFKSKFSLNTLYKPSYNMELEILLLNEMGVESSNTLSQLRKNRPKTLEKIDFNLTEYDQDQQKIHYLVDVGLRDLISQHASYNQRYNVYND